jgi:hypothetical protein
MSEQKGLRRKLGSFEKKHFATESTEGEEDLNADFADCTDL